MAATDVVRVLQGGRDLDNYQGKLIVVAGHSQDGAPKIRRHRRRHAPCVSKSVPVFQPDDLTMLVGPASNGALLELGVITAEGIDFIVHAMNARPEYLGD